MPAGQNQVKPCLLDGRAEEEILASSSTAQELIKKGALCDPMLMVQSLQKSLDVQRPLSCVTGWLEAP